MMMNKKRSSKLQLSNYAFLLPIIIFSAGAFTVTKADDHIIEVVNIAKETDVSELGQVLHIDASSLTDTLKVTDEKRLDTLAKLEEEFKGVDDGLIVMEAIGMTPLADSTDSKKARLIMKGRLNSDRPPLIIVDGVKQVRGYQMNDLNASDITQIQVLKSEQSSDFNEEWKNGVVKIFTKKSGGGAVTNLLLHKSDTSKVQNISTVVVKGSKTETIGILGSIPPVGTALEAKPLIILDGVEKSDRSMSDINPDDIDNISILKNASATAIYGDKGANGVIIITTKVGVGNKTKTVQGVPLAKGDKKEVVVVGYATKSKSLGGDSFYNANDSESLKKFLEDNRTNIDLKSDVVLVINGKVAGEADLKNIKAADVSQVGAIDLTEKNSNLPKNMVGLLFLKDGNPRVNRGASASVYNAKKKIELVVNPDKKDAPYIERK